MQTVSTEQKPKQQKGLECRNCGCRHFRVVYTRYSADSKITRRRQCRNCGKRFTTWEKRIGQ